MNTKRLFLAALAAFAAVFVLDIIFHVNILMGLYEQTVSVWRPQAESKGMMWLMAVNQALFALALAWFYTKGYEPVKPGLIQGLRFGLYAGVLLAASQSLAWYVVLPIPFILNLGWIALSFITMLKLRTTLHFAGLQNGGVASSLVNTVVASALIGLVYRT